MSEFVEVEVHRQQLARLLHLVFGENLSLAETYALSAGVRLARKDRSPLMLPNLERQQPRAFDLGKRILAQLEAADRELSDDQVAQLEAVVFGRLPEVI